MCSVKRMKSEAVLGSLTHELLWNKIDKIRNYDKSLIEVYSAIKKILDLEVIGRKGLLQNMRTEIDLLNKLGTDLKQRPYYMMICDSFPIIKEVLTRRINAQQTELDNLVSTVYDPLWKLITRNDEILQTLTAAERNLASLADLSKSVDERFMKFCKASQTLDLVYEDEQIKLQVKESGKKSGKSTSKIDKPRDKAREEEGAYKYQVEQYNLHAGKLLNTNVSIKRLTPGRAHIEESRLYDCFWKVIQRISWVFPKRELKSISRRRITSFTQGNSKTKQKSEKIDPVLETQGWMMEAATSDAYPKDKLEVRHYNSYTMNSLIRPNQPGITKSIFVADVRTGWDTWHYYERTY